MNCIVRLNDCTNALICTYVSNLCHFEYIRMGNFSDKERSTFKDAAASFMLSYHVAVVISRTAGFALVTLRHKILKSKFTWPAKILWSPRGRNPNFFSHVFS